MCGVLYLLMLSRLWDVASFQRRAMVRERTLRLAGAALASATSAEEIAAAVQNAATALVSQPEPGSRGRVTALLAVRRDGRLRAVIPVPATTPAAVADELSGDRLRELTEGLLPSLDRPRFIPAEEFGVVQPGAVRVGPAEGALLCPLMLKDRPTGDPHIGVLAVYGQQPAARPTCRRRSRSWPARRRWRSSASRSPRRSSGSAARRCSARWCGTPRTRS